MTPPTDDPVEEYLDGVLSCAPGSPRQVRRTLAEVEAHLAESARDLRAEGMPAEAARAEAVRRMGPPAWAVDRPWPAGSARLSRPVRHRLVLAVLQLGGVAGIFVGLAGALAAGIRTIWGASAIATPFPAGAYSQADCRRWLAGYPSSHDCLTAMTADHAADFLRNAVLAGILGVLALAARRLLKRRWPHTPTSAAEPLIGAGLAALCALGFAGAGFDAVTVTRGQGAGQPLALAAAAAGAALLLAGAARRSAGRPFWRRRAEPSG
ncbi:MAG: permease prefix domain 1-containing protein [Jatrophihabitantaceae bacterium]